ncbi:MAG: SpoVA/SpoVAEb family sporulation membrane protein, partial [Alkaliphilus sp.]|nr:SpoVA/SpoVAEb family sporulation membrane protein [Alkaliphilus sp.]
MSKNQPNKDRAYQKYVDTKTPQPNLLENCLWAFFVGGTICAIGEAFHRTIENHYQYSHLDVNNIVTLILIFIGALLTGLGVYDIIGRYA